MARASTEDRRRQIGDAALEAFSNKGFRLTQVTDIAKLAGTAPGTLYLYAPSKEVLFLMAMQRSLGEQPQDLPSDQPDLLEWIEMKIAGSGTARSLSPTGASDSPLPHPSVIIGELWDSIERLAPTIRLIERCAMDWPDLAALFYRKLRPNLLGRLSSYLELGIAQGIVRRPPNVDLAARVILETIAWFAMHRHNDTDGRLYDPAEAKRVTLDALVHAYATDPLGD